MVHKGPSNLQTPGFKAERPNFNLQQFNFELSVKMSQERCKQKQEFQSFVSCLQRLILVSVLKLRSCLKDIPLINWRSMRINLLCLMGFAQIIDFTQGVSKQPSPTYQILK